MKRYYTCGLHGRHISYTLVSTGYQYSTCHIALLYQVLPGRELGNSRHLSTICNIRQISKHRGVGREYL